MNYVRGKNPNSRNGFKKGHIPWTKGKKGLRLSPKTEFKKGHEINLGRKMKSFSEIHKKNISESHKGNKYAFGHKLSEISKEKISKNRKGKCVGENNPNWSGGVTPLNKMLRSRSMWKIWREAVFLRDNFTCQNPNCKFCANKIGVLLHPHHVKPLVLYPELAFRIDNGITYCEEFHLKSGLHKNIKQQMVRVEK